MKYEDIKKPTELLDYMNNNIQYGFVDDKGKIYNSSNEKEFQNGCRTKWRLTNPKRLLKVKYGHCWDQVELERFYFKEHNYNFKTIYIWFELPYDNNYSTHTYLVYEENEKWHYFEHADFTNKGIYSFDTYEDAINFQSQKFIEANKKKKSIERKELDAIRIYEYDTPKYNCNMNEFINHILETGKEIKIPKNKL